MFTKIIEWFYPFTDKEEDFVLKNVPTWYSNKYRYILYSGNCGKTFHKLLNAEPPLFNHGDCILEYDWGFTYFTFSAETRSFTQYKERFNTLKDINLYEDEEYERYLAGKEAVRKARKVYKEGLYNNTK